jgi:hypothetical protein
MLFSLLKKNDLCLWAYMYRYGSTQWKIMSQGAKVMENNRPFAYGNVPHSIIKKFQTCEEKYCRYNGRVFQ